MMRLLTTLPLALFLAAAFPVCSLADDTADACRQMAIDDEVAPEDMEDYIAECLAVVQSDSPEEAVEAMEQLEAITPDAAPDPAP
jgi:uncharacterized protein Yka (UPF0111/DUF47 family)